MRAALREATLDALSIDHVNAHATSTPIGDIAEIKATALSLYHQIIPPTLNFEDCEEPLESISVTTTAKSAPIRAALCNSFGFGGINASLCFIHHAR